MTMRLPSPVVRCLWRTAIAAGGLLAPLFAVSGQASLSAQGFGYAPGQLSTRAQGTGGSVGEMDPMSPINPATIAVFPSRILFFQRHKLAAAVVGIVAATGISFSMSRWIVFSRRPPPDAKAGPGGRCQTAALAERV